MVVEPPPSRQRAVTQPSSFIRSASAPRDAPMLWLDCRPSMVYSTRSPLAFTPTAVRGAAETSKPLCTTPPETSRYSAPMASVTSFQLGSGVVKETVTVCPGVRERRKARASA